MIARRFWPIACLLAGLCPVGTLSAQEDERPNDAGTFAIFDQLNALEIAVGRAGAEKGRADEVRALGRMIAGDQETMQRQGRELGLKLKIFARPPANELGSYSQTVARLRSIPEAEFDAAYLKQEVALQRNVIDALSGLQPSIRDPGFAAFMRGVIQSFERHREAAQATSKNLASE
jgi:predicted outer membrane protein